MNHTDESYMICLVAANATIAVNPTWYDAVAWSYDTGVSLKERGVWASGPSSEVCRLLSLLCLSFPCILVFCTAGEIFAV